MIRKIDSSEIRRISSSSRCRRKDTLRLRKASNLAADRKQPETVRLPCGGSDEADPECQLPVRTRNRNTPRKRTIPEVRRQTRSFDQEKWCALRQGVMHTSRRFTKSCVRARDSLKSWRRAQDSQKLCVRAERVQNSQPCGSSKRDGALVQPVVEDPVDADRFLVETGAEPFSVPCEPSESEKTKHELTRIPFTPWCTSCVKGKAQSEPHKCIERTIEDSEPSSVQCDYLVLADTASDGLKSFEHVCEIVWVQHIHSC